MNNSNQLFNRRLNNLLEINNFIAVPICVASALNKHCKTTVTKPHTVRKWLLAQSQPKSETFVFFASWLNVESKDLIAVSNKSVNMRYKFSFEFDFTEQEVISKYLSMPVNEKVTVRLVIVAITDKHK